MSEPAERRTRHLTRGLALPRVGRAFGQRPPLAANDNQAPFGPRLRRLLFLAALAALAAVYFSGV
ncbi:MAG: hypothetical protein FJX46_04235 [Alphaproteobacteria bacterium]|nr:hypothetical protein [Alphaproteobacteria bacterium]